jgi:hypothetical protein
VSVRSTYDSDAYIQYLSYILRAVTGEEPVAWVTREFAVPLGLSTLWLYDGLNGDVSAGGGQLYTCRGAPLPATNTLPPLP